MGAKLNKIINVIGVQRYRTKQNKLTNLNDDSICIPYIHQVIYIFTAFKKCPKGTKYMLDLYEKNVSPVYIYSCFWATN